MEKIDQSVKENFASGLKALGLSTYASGAYLALLYHPGVSAGFLCNETGIPDSKMYYALNELSKKGMIIAQKGTPSIYKPLHPKEAIGNLKQQLAEDFNENIKKADTLADSLSPIFENVESKEEIELAYVIRGQRNIVKKMRDLITFARNEVMALISESDLLDELISPMMKAKDHAEIKLAITKNLFKNEKLRELIQPRILLCSCSMIVSDMRTLITVSSWKNEIAIMTNDKGLMTMCREYYESCKVAKDTHKTAR